MIFSATSKKNFEKKILSREHEDFGVIKHIETELKRKRGWVFQLPKPEQPVVLLLSGGLDSIVAWHLLMKKYGLMVYPLVINKGMKRTHLEMRSVKYYSKLYQKLFPDLYQAPFHINLPLTEISIGQAVFTEKVHPLVILENLTDSAALKLSLSLGSSILTPFVAKLYAQFLYSTQHLTIKTIFCAVTKGDGENSLVPEQTFTALRTMMWSLCVLTRDYEWQYASVALEKELGNFLSKADLIAWADQHQIPLEHTWTCYHPSIDQTHCGECITCSDRIKSFEKVGVIDRTIYYDQKASLYRRLIDKFKLFIRYYFNL
ncbi:MAG TPA: hypothetical protein DEP87_03925 [Candidatus Pacebacteria bacterium]|nr:hypothetical protein [Candidatus Paceibacterota bacterium]